MVTEEMSAFFNEDNTDKVEDLLIKDLCTAISNSFEELSMIFKDKIITIQNAIKELPDLYPFDLFAAKVRKYLNS